MRNRAAESAKLPPKVHMTLVEAREIKPRRDVTPARWLLLTTHPVTSFNDTRGITRIYRARWTIEQVNRTMKTEGFRIETSRVAEGGPFENLAAAVLIAAVQVMQLVGDRDGTAGRPLEDVFDPADRPALEAICATLEGSTARQKNSYKRGSLAYGTWVCARLAGWTAYHGKAGPVVILRGLLLFKAMRHGCMLGQSMRSKPKRCRLGGRKSLH
jgi:Transposase DDE domain